MPPSIAAETYFLQPSPYDGRNDAHHSDYRLAATNGAVIFGRSADDAASATTNCAATKAASPR